MDKEELEKFVKLQNPGASTGSIICNIVRNHSPLETSSWDEARKILSGSEWAYAGDPELDDSGDTAYSCSFNHEALSKVVAGIVYQQIKGQKMVIRSLEKDGEGYKLIMSPGSARQLNKLAPSMTLRDYTLSAGHVAGGRGMA